MELDNIEVEIMIGHGLSDEMYKVIDCYEVDNEMINKVKEIFDSSDAVLVGVGSGMSSSAGFNHYHDDESFRLHFSDYKENYGINSMMDGYYHLFSSPEEEWAYYARYIQFMYDSPVGTPYKNLHKLLKDKKYFILTTNVDMQVSEEFPEEKICCFQGDFKYFQCSQPCNDRIYPNEKQIREMVEETVNFRIPSELIPRCPECGRKMVPWVRDDTFLEGAYWRDAYQRYVTFVNEYIDKKLTLLELGVGEMTPAVINLPFWEMVQKNENCVLINVTLDRTTPPLHIKDKNLNIQMDAGHFLTSLDS